MNGRPLIDHHLAIKGLRLAVADRGVEYIDPHAQSGGCRYVNLVTEEPGCIAATALFKLGVSLDELRQWEGCTANAMVPGEPAVSPNRGQADGIITADAGQVLRRAQEPQDKGYAWGICLLDAEDMYRLIVEEEQA